MTNGNSTNLSNCDYCDYCNYCDSCDFCYYSKRLRMSERMIFCLGEGSYETQGAGYQKNYHAFNKPISKDRHNIILKLINGDILKDLKLELNEENWIDEWKKVSNRQWKQISEIPEFDKEVVEGIIGFELNLNEDEMVSIKISKKSADSLGLKY